MKRLPLLQKKRLPLLQRDRLALPFHKVTPHLLFKNSGVSSLTSQQVFAVMNLQTETVMV
jgi:hypothetical protein